MYMICVNDKKDKISKKMVIDANMNAHKELQHYLNNKNQTNDMLISIKNLFHLNQIPHKVATFDNSHRNGQFAIGAMVFYENGEFVKTKYRKVNFEDTNDDYKMMYESVKKRIISFNKDIDSIDLLIIDGGIGHANIVKSLMNEVNIYIDFLCITKGENRNDRSDYFISQNGEVINLRNDAQEYKFIEKMRNEAHRFSNYCSELLYLNQINNKI